MVPQSLAIALKYEEYRSKQDGELLTAILASVLLLIGLIALVQV